MGNKARRQALLRRLIGFRVLVGLIVIILLSPLYMYFSHDVSMLNNHWPHVVKESDGDVEYELKPVAPKYWVRLNGISHYARWAVVLSEDWGFYKHQGVDFEELKKAVDESLRERRLVRGASTISQQVVKNVFLSSSRSLWRKAHEMVLAQKMERVVDKKRILEIYFNIVELGPGIYGIQQASYHYFKKHPSALNPREAAFIAMLLPSPKRYYISYKQRHLTRFARGRIRSILTKMRWAKIISWEEWEMWNGSRFGWES